MQQHAIPQNIMSYEFKLVAGLTLKQFIFIAVGGAISFGLAMATSRQFIQPIVGWPLLAIVLTVTISFALVRIQNRSLDAWFQDYTNAFKSPTRRIWKKDWKPVKINLDLSTKPLIFPDYLRIYFEEPEDLEEELQYIQQAQKAQQLQQMQQAQQRGGQPAVQPPPTVVQAQQVAMANQQMASGNPNAQLLIISSANASQFAMDANRYLKVANIVAFVVVNNSNQPLANVVGLLKKATGEVISGLRSNTNGVLFFDKPLPNGSYLANFEAPNYRFPNIQLVLEGATPLPVIKVPAIAQP